MKSKHIPDDIKNKTVEEAQNELQSIMSELEADNAILENSMDKYTRMLQLNYHILQKFKKKNYLKSISYQQIKKVKLF